MSDDGGIFKHQSSSVVRVIPKNNLDQVVKVDFSELAKSTPKQSQTQTHLGAPKPSKEATEKIYRRAFEEGFVSGRSTGLEAAKKEIDTLVLATREINRAMADLRALVSLDVADMATGLANALALSMPISGDALKDRVLAGLSVLSGDQVTLEADESTLDILRACAPEVLERIKTQVAPYGGCRLSAGKGWVDLGLNGRLALVMESIQEAAQEHTRLA